MMKTYTGLDFDPEAPQASQISIEDIAQGLSMQARFCGQLEQFYSVAEHSVMVSRILRTDLGHPELALHGLLHDAHEAYTSDIPSPVKALLGRSIVTVEEKIDAAIFKAFSLAPLSPEQKQSIKQADYLAFLLEDKFLRGGYVIHDIELPQMKVRALGPTTGKRQFLQYFDFLNQEQE